MIKSWSSGCRGLLWSGNVNQKFQRMLREPCTYFSHTKTDLNTETIHRKNRKNSMISYFLPCTLSNMKHETSHFTRLRVGSLCAETPNRFFPGTDSGLFRLVVVRWNVRFKLHKKQFLILFVEDIPMDSNLFWLYMARTAVQVRTWLMSRNLLRWKMFILIVEQPKISSWAQHWGEPKCLFFECVRNTPLSLMSFWILWNLKLSSFSY